MKFRINENNFCFNSKKVFLNAGEILKFAANKHKLSQRGELLNAREILKFIAAIQKEPC